MADSIKLNPLQTRTLALLQELARDPDIGQPAPQGGIAITHMPHAHGDHVHVGSVTVSARDASGLGNKAVWQVLERKGLIDDANFPHHLVLTPTGQNFETGLAERLAQVSDH
jgi:ribosomal protein S19E (S16A)